ncbi:hypothetical protein SUGI_0208590 [Cryptomeria japonica]|nr:hypothetical protein SUGI_0208590 [Cryptomeria japonica]
MDCQRCKLDASGEFPGFQDLASDPVEKLIPDEDDNSDIGNFAKISGCLDKQRQSEKQLGSPLEEDLKSWGHHELTDTVPDLILQAAAVDEVTFVFTNQVDGKLTPMESGERNFSSQMSNVLKKQMPIGKFLVGKTSQLQGFTAPSHQQASKDSKTEKEPMISKDTVENNSGSMKPTDIRPNSHRFLTKTSCLSGRIHVDRKWSRTISNHSERTLLPAKRMLSEKNNLDDDFA